MSTAVRPFALGRRQQAVLASAAGTGLVVGLAVAGFERLTDAVLLARVLDAPTWVMVAAPAVGLALAALALRFIGGGASAGTADQYVLNFHDRGRLLALRPLPGRLAAGVSTIGFGGAMGLEGPSIYMGAAVGSAIQRRFRTVFRRSDAKVLLVAGAAAGVAAVFKAPATGVVFALEVPYTDDVAHRALIPALVASATSYLVFVGLVGTERLFPVFGPGSDFGLEDLAGAIALGLLAGGGARLFAVLTTWAKHLNTRWPARWRVPVAGAALAGLAAVALAVYGEPFTLGPGYDVVRWSAGIDRSLTLLALLFVLRAAATVTTVAGGGAGGLFIPLAVQGTLLGRFVAEVLGRSGTSLFPVIGVAAFLGAGYRTPIASVMFVAETTGRAGFVVPALLAAAAAQLMMGRASVSSAQQSTRAGHLERRFRLPVTSALTTDVLTVPPDATVAEFMWGHVVGRRERTVPVVEGDRYLGMCSLDDLSSLPREEWTAVPVAEVMRGDVPVARPSWTLRDAMAAMERADVELLPVADSQGAFIGIVHTAEILKLDEILDETGG